MVIQYSTTAINMIINKIMKQKIHRLYISHIFYLPKFVLVMFNYHYFSVLVYVICNFL